MKVNQLFETINIRILSYLHRPHTAAEVTRALHIPLATVHTRIRLMYADRMLTQAEQRNRAWAYISNVKEVIAHLDGDFKRWTARATFFDGRVWEETFALEAPLWTR